jgi:hypothetical protein
MRRVHRLLLCLAFLAPSLLFAPLAHAATMPKGITISPFLQDIRVQADDATKDLNLDITNNTTQEQTLRLTVIDFGSLNDTGGVIFAGTNEDGLLAKYGLAHWLKLDVSTLTVASGKKVAVHASIVNDNSLQPGGHYAAVVASVDSPGDSFSSTVAINQQLSSLIFATKVGGEKYDLKLDSARPQSSHFGLPKAVSLDFTNPGNVHVVPRGTIRVLGAHDTIISQGIINEESGYILPETSRKYIIDMHGVGAASWWPRTYKLVVNYRYDGYDTFATKTYTIRYVNIPVIILGVLCISGMTFLVIKVLRKSKK